MFLEGSDKDFPSLKHSTLKLTMLLALTSTARASEIHLLDVRLLVKHSSGYIFQFRKKTPKNQNKVNQGLLLIFLHWLKTKNCAYHHTDLYLKRTIIMQERITYIVKFYWNPPNNFHNNIIKMYCGSTWCVHQVLTQIKSFTAHSTRAASSSKAKVLGVPTREILNYNFWKILLLLGNFEVFEEKPFQQWLSSSRQMRRQTSYRSGGGFMKWNSELHQRARSTQQSSSNFKRNIEANDLIFPSTSPINVVNLIILCISGFLYVYLWILLWL